MSISMAVICSVSAFIIGFLLGLFDGHRPKTAPQRAKVGKNSDTLRKLNEEYRNFLSYDGSEQN